jgi:hypothetical protein
VLPICNVRPNLVTVLWSFLDDRRLVLDEPTEVLGVRAISSLLADAREGDEQQQEGCESLLAIDYSDSVSVPSKDFDLFTHDRPEEVWWDIRHLTELEDVIGNVTNVIPERLPVIVAVPLVIPLEDRDEVADVPVEQRSHFNSRGLHSCPPPIARYDSFFDCRDASSATDTKSSATSLVLPDAPIQDPGRNSKSVGDVFESSDSFVFGHSPLDGAGHESKDVDIGFDGFDACPHHEPAIDGRPQAFDVPDEVLRLGTAGPTLERLQIAYVTVAEVRSKTTELVGAAPMAIPPEVCR